MAFNQPQKHRSEDHQSTGINCLPGRLVFAAYATNISNDRRHRKVETYIARVRCLERFCPNSNFRGPLPVPEPNQMVPSDRVRLVLDQHPPCLKATPAEKTPLTNRCGRNDAYFCIELCT